MSATRRLSELGALRRLYLSRWKEEPGEDLQEVRGFVLGHVLPLICFAGWARMGFAGRRQRYCNRIVVRRFLLVWESLVTKRYH